MWIALNYGLLGAVAGPVAMIAGLRIARNEPTVSAYLSVWPLLSVGVATATALIYVACRLPHLVAVVSWLVIIGLVVSSIDWTCRRLPHRLSGLLLAGGLILLGCTALAKHEVPSLLRACAAMGAVFSCWMVLHLCSPRQAGLGDVTLSTAVALFLGWSSWQHLVTGFAVAFVLAGASAAVLLTARVIRFRQGVAMGPALIGGALYAIVQT
ncbi:prepilin peptidase [Lentzea sp. NPDC006480]|uniref:prepilin peptidase n=1 Tax=Lentzea sp. NPDC006480 TaxID=3157176 RepID=UPI0033A4E98A